MSHLTAALPADLATLVDGVGVRLTAAEIITPLRAHGVDRVCFRLAFADGRVLKGRHMETLEQATRLETLTARLDRRHFPALLERHGRAFLTEWVQGTPLNRRRCTRRILEECGAVHAAVHRIAVDTCPQWRRRHGGWQTRMMAGLRLLVDAARLEADVARRAEALAIRFAPSSTKLGMCHGDLCAENIVIDRAGRVVIVDNDSIAVDAWGYDFARTWYRWPMAANDWRYYMAGYGPAAYLPDIETHFIHWALTVLIEAAAYRVRVAAGGAERALEALRSVLDDPDRRARFTPLVADGASAP